MKGLVRFEKSGNATADAVGFELQVQSWLETLSTEASLAKLTPELRRPLRCTLFPLSPKVPFAPGIHAYR